MNGRMKQQLHSNLQLAYKILFSIVFLVVLVISIIHLFSGQVENYIPALVWLVVIGILEFLFLPTSRIYFDKDHVYLHNSLRNGHSVFNIVHIKKVRVSFNGFFTTLEILDGNKIKKYRCFNNIHTVSKYNKSDPFNIYKGLKSGSSVIDELKYLIASKLTNP